MKRHITWPKQYRTYVLGIVGIIAIVACVRAVVLYVAHAVRITSYTLSFDQRFSPEHRITMRQWLSKSLFKQPFSVTREQFCAAHPSVGHVKRSYKSWRHAHMKVAARPLCLVCNDQHAVALDNRVVTAADYLQEYKGALAKVNVPDEKQLTDEHVGEMVKFMQRVPESIKNTYTFVWHDPTNIELNHQDGNVQVVTMHTTEFTDALCAALDTWVQQGKKVRIDVRYQGQMVLYDREKSRVKGRGR